MCYVENDAGNAGNVGILRDAIRGGDRLLSARGLENGTLTAPKRCLLLGLFPNEAIEIPLTLFPKEVMDVTRWQTSPLVYYDDGLFPCETMDIAVGPISYLGNEAADVTRWQSALLSIIMIVAAITIVSRDVGYHLARWLGPNVV